MWHSLVVRSVRDRKVASSNLVTSTSKQSSACFEQKKTPIISAIFFTLFCLRFASVHRQDSPKCVTLAKCSLFRRYAPYKSCHGGKTLPIICENALCVFLLYGRFFLFRKKSRKLNFLRCAHFVRKE